MKESFRFGFILFILSEVMFFVSFFWAFFCFSVIPVCDVGGVWPTFGVTGIPPLGIPLLNTVILLSSGMTVTFSHACLKSFYNRLYGYVGLILTLLLGYFFLVVQFVEYGEAGFSVSDGVFGTSFFMLTGLHGIHVLLGCILLTGCFFRFFSFNSESHVGYECRIWYWHFVDVVWLFLFGFVYVWRVGL